MHAPSSSIAYLALAALATGCGHFGGAPSMAAGVTTGGAQDVGLARNQLAAGRLPAPEAFTLEGLLGEHDIAIAAPPCRERFCMDTAVGVAPALDTGEEAAFMVVGFSSGLDLTTFRRAPLNLALVVDRSGSMAGGKMAAAREALHRILRQLRPDDRVAIIAFDDDVDLVVPSVALRRGVASLHPLVDEIDVDGATDIEAALAAGYEQIAPHAGPEVESRVLLITDARPNTGRTGRDDFLGLAGQAAARGLGLTVVGVGLDFGQQLSLDISRLPGGSYLYVEDAAKLERLFDRDFDLMMSPVAWDFDMVVEPLPGTRIVAAYGVPSDVLEEGGGALRLHIPTLFLSRNRGAIVLRLEPDASGGGLAPGPLATTRLGWRDARRAPRHEAPGRVFLDGEARALEHDPGLARAVTLVNTGLGLQAATRLAHQGQLGEALAVLAAVEAVTAGEGYGAERELVAGLRRVIEGRRAALDGPDRGPQEGRAQGPEEVRWVR